MPPGLADGKAKDRCGAICGAARQRYLPFVENSQFGTMIRMSNMKRRASLSIAVGLVTLVVAVTWARNVCVSGAPDILSPLFPSIFLPAYSWPLERDAIGAGCAGGISLTANAVLRFLPRTGATWLRSYSAYVASVAFAACVGLLVAEAMVPRLCKSVPTPMMSEKS
jgi:hypothetical protein